MSAGEHSHLVELEGLYMSAGEHFHLVEVEELYNRACTFPPGGGREGWWGLPIYNS